MSTCDPTVLNVVPASVLGALFIISEILSLPILKPFIQSNSILTLIYNIFMVIVAALTKTSTPLVPPKPNTVGYNRKNSVTDIA
jgi:hypothetical protein